MAYVTLQDLKNKGLRASMEVDHTGNFNPVVTGGSSLEKIYYASMLKEAFPILHSYGIRPQTFEVSAGDNTWTESAYTESQIFDVMKDKGFSVGINTAGQVGNPGSSGAWSLPVAVLDKNKNPIAEWKISNSSWGGFLKDFASKFGSIILAANAGANLLAPGSVAAAGGVNTAVIGETIAAGAPAAVQSAVTNAVVSGSMTALAGGDAEDVIKNALVGGATGAVSELAKPYIQDAIDFVKDLTPEGLQDVVAAAGDAGDVAGNVADVDVGGAGDVGFGDASGGIDLGAPPQLASMSPAAYDVYFEALAQGADPADALLRAVRAEQFFTNTSIGGVADTSSNALLGGGAAGATTPANALADGTSAMPMAGATGLYNPQTGAPTAMGARYEDLVNSGLPSDVAYSQVLQEFSGTSAVTGAATSGAVTSPGGVATVDLTGGQTAGAGTVADTGAGLDTAGTAAGVAGAGAAAAGAGAAGAGAAGAATGAGGEMIDLGADPLYGGAYTGSGAAESALTGATAGTAAGAAAGLTGIAAVDDFLKYLGTPAGAMALGAFGSLAGGYLTGQAAKDAAQIQANAAANALALQREQFEYQKELLDPYRRRGESALNRLAGVMGLDGQPAQPQQLLEMDPGYAFRLGEGMKALERVQAARGNMLSGGAIKAGQRYAQDFASNEYGNAYNRLANIAGLGQTVGGQLGTAAQQFGQTAGETMSQSANALAAGRINRTSGYMGGIGGAVGAYQNYQNQQQQNQLFGKFLDIYGRAVGAGG